VSKNGWNRPYDVIVRRLLAALLGGGVLASAASCLEPTEVRITIKTNICATLDVSIAVNDQPPSTKNKFPPKDCDKGTHALGDIVFVPSGTGNRFTFKVTGCSSDTQCATASRNIAYLPHTPLALDVELTADCVNVTCPDNATCVHGDCVSNVLDCKDKTCNDGGLVSDAQPKPDAVAAGCAPQMRSIFGAATPTFWWTFTPTSMGIKEQKTMAAAMIVPPNTTSMSNMAFGCGDAFSIVTTQPLNVTHVSLGIGISAYVYAPSNKSSQIILRKHVGSIQGVVIFLTAQQHQLWAQRCNVMSACSDDQFPAVPADRWFLLEMQVTTAATTAAIDGMPLVRTNPYNPQPTAFGAGTLEMGPGDTGLVDELYVFDSN
jgi:hypothetical protein